MRTPGIYEYAVQNLNSDQAARQFFVNVISGGGSVTNIGFHDVDYHSGEVQGGADWTPSNTGNAVFWSGPTFQNSTATDNAANALRWGTMYNFRFDADAAPGQGLATIGLFKPGTVSSVDVSVILPGGTPIAPINDECSGALTIAAGTTTFNTATATDSGPAEPTACNFSGFTNISKDLWYRYTPACTGNATITTCGSSFDTKIAVYAGACPAAAAAIACNDDAGSCGGNGLQSSLTFAATGGATYYLRVGGFTNLSGAGAINITDPFCEPPPGPANDLCANAIRIYDGVAGTGTNVSATSDGSATCAANAQDVWFVYTPASTAQVTINTCNSTFDTVLSVHTGTCGNLTQVGCNDDNTTFGSQCFNTLQSRVRMTLTGGTQYYLRVAGFNDGTTTATGNITILVTGGGGTAPPPANNTCADAAVVTNGSYAYTTVGATTDGPADTVCNFFNNNQIGRDVWYRYTALCNGDVTVDICSSSFDTKLGVYAMPCPTAGVTAIVCNDDVCGAGQALQSRVTFAATGGQQYLIRVGGFGNASGTGTMVITGPDCTPPGPANDNCNNRAGVGDGAIPFDTTNATTDGPAHAECGSFVKDIWFNYPAQTTGTLSISTCTSAYDSKIAVYTGDHCADLTSRLIACSDNDCDDDGLLEIDIVDGNSYTIRIGGGTGANGSGGQGHLNLISTPTPTGACCAHSGACDVRTEADCVESAGTYQGNGTDCGAANCAPPSGACCLSDGSCSETTEAMCAGGGGTYQGDDSACEPANCPQPTGACCLADGSCTSVTSDECASAGGAYQGHDSTCEAANCPQPTGACCAPDGTCSTGTAGDCSSHGGVYQGDGTACETANCPQPTGACCHADGSCTSGTSDDCAAAGGSYQGHDSTCEGANCPQPTGACCIDRCTCMATTEADCAAQSGVYGGDNSECGGSFCLANPACPCDWNGFDGLDSQDLFDFLEGFFSGAGDFNCFDGTDSQDYFDYIECFFNGCN